LYQHQSLRNFVLFGSRRPISQLDPDIFHPLASIILFPKYLNWWWTGSVKDLRGPPWFRFRPPRSYHNTNSHLSECRSHVIQRQSPKRNSHHHPAVSQDRAIVPGAKSLAPAHNEVIPRPQTSTTFSSITACINTIAFKRSIFERNRFSQHESLEKLELLNPTASINTNPLKNSSF
jgi:hypothetical protein